MPNPTKVEPARALLRAGLSNSAIARQLRMDKHDVAKLRAEMGLANVPAQPLTVEQKWRQRVRELPGGHLEWTGERQRTSGTPVMRHSGQCYTAARIAYRIQHGSDPAGHAAPGCGLTHCVAPGHIDDTARRQRDRAALRIVLGSPQRPSRCRHGHDQAEHGRFGPDGVAYCAACKTDRRSASPKN
ncbi:hypothetical protein [Kitasatospora cathayae]|uniref:HNH nuclease domain-containing protein n=1 Tax=Kitasatospora cathayae TaxID=3004092 RepID=A0ABY7QH85_9ACTN|nr:hypothetical protein [Kitasatospora sp. HUAS 3-15]WBP92206.1 hypothetical protein O1G21_41090 [Kitasatospora sp. HUAS 3-15]